MPAGAGLDLLGHARLDLRVAVDRPVATVSAKLCDVAADGTSTLITRGLLNLTHRDGHASPRPVTPGEYANVEVELEATAWTVLPGHRLRLAVTGVDWPNTVAPPEPVILTVDGDASVIRLPTATGRGTAPVPTALRHLDPPVRDGEHPGIVWRVSDDVLARVTSCAVDHGSAYDIVGPGSCTDRYVGTVTVERRSWRQSASSTASFEIAWPEATVRTATTVELIADGDRFDAVVTVEAAEGGTVLASRTLEAVGSSRARLTG